MENIEYSKSLYQINEIIKYMTPNLKSRIPKKFISYFENNKSKDYNWKIDETIPLETQNMLPNTKEILSVLYKDYICDDLREKYNPDNIFKNKTKEVIDTITENESTSVTTYKESFFSKIINKIKLIFHK